MVPKLILEGHPIEVFLTLMNRYFERNLSSQNELFLHIEIDLINKTQTMHYQGF